MLQDFNREEECLLSCDVINLVCTNMNTFLAVFMIAGKFR